MNIRIVDDTDPVTDGCGLAEKSRRPWKTPVVILSKLADANKPTTFPTENIGSLPPTATGPS